MALELARDGKVATFGDEVTELRIALQRVQHELRSAPFSVLVLLAGDDARAAEAGMRVLNEWMDPRNLRILAFDRPTDDERARPTFWRYWRVLPSRGSVALFLGGWTMNAVADRLDGALDRTLRAGPRADPRDRAGARGRRHAHSQVLVRSQR